MRSDRIQVGPTRRLAGWSLGLAAGLWRWSRRRNRSRDAADTRKRVTVLEPYGMGDVISLEPLLRSLTDCGYAVTLVAQERWRTLYEGTPRLAWLNSAVPWTSYRSERKYRLGSYAAPEFRSFLRQLGMAAKDSIGIDPRGDVRSLLLLHRAGCREVLSLKHYLGTDLVVPDCAAATVEPPVDLRRWEVNLLFLEKLGIAKVDSRVPPRFEHLEARPAIRDAQRLGLVSVAPWEGKHWAAERWRRLIEQTRVAGWEPVGLCGPGQLASAGVEWSGSVPVEECPDLKTWAVALQRCACVITVDSGPMHLADALGVPVIALFGQGKIPLWAPSGPSSHVIHHQQDSDFVPCHPLDRNVPLGRRFMDRIEVAEVLERLKQVNRG